MLRTVRLIALFSGLLVATFAQAHDVDPLTYGYPLTNPFEATIATTPPPLRPELPDDDAIKQADHSLDLRIERAAELPSIFWPVERFQYRLAQQPGKAPLIFIIAGTGSRYSNTTMEFLKKLYYGAGYHVVQLSSPTSYDFIVSASRHATPGYTPDDARDLYHVMKAIRAAHPGLAISDYMLTGYSLGALDAAFVSELDEREQAFNFKRVLLINPPVNLYTSVTNLDRLVQTRVNGIDNSTNFYDLVLGKITRYFNERGGLDIDAAMLYDFQQSKEQLSDEELAMLIGSAFRFFAADIVFTSDVVNRRGLLVPRDAELSEGSSLTPFMQLAMRCDFECYLNEQLMPMWRERDGGKNLDQLINQVSLYALEDYLKSSRKIAVMHNADDLILGPGDLGFLRRTFADRLTVYPLGGHCGNLNYTVNSQAMLEFFRD